MFITNTAANPVPVAPQGTTRVAGTVTVANQPESAQRVPFQRSFSGPMTRDNPSAGGYLDEVPPGKTLTIEHAQVKFSTLFGTELHEAFLAVSCEDPPPEEPVSVIRPGRPVETRRGSPAGR